jgi:hypothetical protein
VVEAGVIAWAGDEQEFLDMVAAELGFPLTFKESSTFPKSHTPSSQTPIRSLSFAVTGFRSSSIIMMS